MIWELIATIVAGLGAAGIVMGLRLLYKNLPKGLIPAGAGVGMLAFQIYSEYTWFTHTESLLPEGTVVLARVPERSWYKPWSAWRAPVLKFVALDTKNTALISEQPKVLRAHLYFFERRMSAHSWAIIFDCQNQHQANAPAENAPLEDLHWYQNDYSPRVAEHICRK